MFLNRAWKKDLISFLNLDAFLQILLHMLTCQQVFKCVCITARVTLTTKEEETKQKIKQTETDALSINKSVKQLGETFAIVCAKIYLMYSPHYNTFTLRAVFSYTAFLGRVWLIQISKMKKKKGEERHHTLQKIKKNLCPWTRRRVWSTRLSS